MARQVIRDLGDKVYCDFCGDEWTNRNDHGGLLFQSKAVCPGCAPGIERDATHYGEDHLIRARPEPGQSFADFVRGLRGGNNEVVMLTGEDFDRAMFGDAEESEGAK